MDKQPPCNKIFTYGTLRKGQGAYFNFGLDKLKYIGEKHIAGTMYDQGWYPGIRVAYDGETNKTFIGDLFEFDDPSVLERLDGYEGCPHLYTRKLVHTTDGELTYVYEINRPANRPVPGGDWLVYKQKEGGVKL